MISGKMLDVVDSLCIDVSMHITFSAAQNKHRKKTSNYILYIYYIHY